MAVGAEVVVVVGGVGELDGDARAVAVGLEQAVEVILSGGRCAHRGGYGELTLPLLGADALGDGQCPCAGLVGVGGVGNLRPVVVGEPLRHFGQRRAVLDGRPQVGGRCGIPVHGRLVARGLFVLAVGQDEAPCDGVGRIVVDQHHLLGSERFDAEARVGILVVGRHVGERRVWRQHQIVGLADVAVGVGPTARLEVPRRGLRSDFDVGVLVVRSAPQGHALVDVGQAVVAGAVGVGTAGARVGREGEAVVVEAEVLLLVGSGGPPAGSVGAQLAAAEVRLLFACNAPFLAGDALEVGRPVDLGLVEGEGLDDAALADAVAVAQPQLDAVGAGFGVAVSDLVEGRVGGAVDEPHGVEALRRRQSCGHLVGFLVHGHLKVDAAHGGEAGLRCSVKFVGLARCGCHRSQHQSRQESEYLVHSCVCFWWLIIVLNQRGVGVEFRLCQRDVFFGRCPGVGAVSVGVGHQRGGSLA